MPQGGGEPTAGIVMQVARVDRLGREFVNAGSKQILCGQCRQRCWITPQAAALAGRPTCLRPICDVCKPAKAVGHITPDKHG